MNRNIRRSLRCAFGLLVLHLLAPVGCASDTETRALVAPSASGGGTTGGTTDTGTTTGGDPVVGANKLSFESAVDASGLPCGQSCLEVLAVGITEHVNVLYQAADGSPIADAQISFESDFPDSVLRLEAKSAFTNAQGRATLVLTAQPGASGAGSVRIAAAGDTTSNTLSLQIAFDIELIPPLQVQANYVGKQTVPGFDVHLFLQQGGSPLCSDVHPDAPGLQPQPVMVKSGLLLGQSIVVDGLPGLAEAGTQTWVVQVRGPTQSPTPTAAGCDTIEVTDGETRQLQVTVGDLPLKFGGSYDVVTKADMHTGLEGDAGSVISFLVGLFSEPGKTALVAACQNPSGYLDTLCGFLVSGSDLTAGGIAVAQIADEAFLELMKDQLPAGVFFSGESLAHLLRQMRFGSSLTFTQEPSVPSPTGGAAFPEQAATEVWETVSYLWTYGLNCAPGDDTCGLQTVKLSDIYGVTLEATFGAGVTEDSSLWIEKHVVPGFDYGTLVNFIVEKKVLPLLFGDGTKPGPEGTNLPSMDTYEEVIATIFGDEVCLVYSHPSSNFGDCCWWFSQKQAVKDYTDSIPVIGETVAIEGCNLAVAGAGIWIRNEVTGLGGPLHVGTPEGAPCKAADQTDDRNVNTLGDASTPCTWDVEIDFSGTPFKPDSTWHAKHD